MFKIGNSSRLGYCKPGLEAISHPTPLDIAWAAGIYEGEGNVTGYSYYDGHSHTTLRIIVTQKKPWILNLLKQKFGGSICRHGVCFQWSITGTRARGFAMTIYQFLSPHRQEQIKWNLIGKKP